MKIFYPYDKDTAEAMKELLNSKTPNTKAFDLPSKYRMADMLRADLEDAGIEKIEKQLHIEKPYLVNIAGIEIMSDEFEKLFKKIQAEGKGLEIKKYPAREQETQDNE